MEQDPDAEKDKASPPRGTPTKRSKESTPTRQIQKHARTEVHTPRQPGSLPLPQNPTKATTHHSDNPEERMYESEDDKIGNDDGDDDASMNSYDTTDDRSAVIGNDSLDFDTEESNLLIQAPPTIAKIPIDTVFEQLE